MKRLTVEKTVREMTGTELAHNCMYARDRWAWYRNFDKDMNLLDFIREFGKVEKAGALPADNEVLGEMLLDGLQYGIDNPFGRVALVYNLMWAMADLREGLKAYEDTGLTPEQIYEMCAEEREVPKKPVVNTYFYFCPNCGSRRNIRQKHMFCHDCGQAFDW